MRGRQVYIDTNVFIYVALKHPGYYRRCYRVLEMLVEKEFTGYGSSLVVFELFGALSRISVEAAYEAVNSYLDLPLRILKINRETLEYAKEIALYSKTTYDSIHAALVAQNNVEVVVTEDLEDWKKILKIWPRIKKKFNTKNITIVSPTKGIIKT